MKLQTVIAVIVREQVYSHGLFSFVFWKADYSSQSLSGWCLCEPVASFPHLPTILKMNCQLILLAVSITHPHLQFVFLFSLRSCGT